jgi:hypothetical protein
MSIIGLEIRPQCAFLLLGRSCPPQTILLSDLVRCAQLSAVSNGLLAYHYCQQRAVTLESLNSNKKGTKLPLLSAGGCHTRLDGQHCPMIREVSSKVEKPSDDMNSHLFLMNKKG